MDVKTWVLTGVVTILLGAFGWVLSVIAKRTLDRLDAILNELQKLNNMLTRHEEKLEQITETLHEHNDRIKVLESNYR